MAGITHVLSIAKEALLAHQMSIQVASHNVANVDTPGYSRQTLKLEANNPAPVGAGMLGGGVRASAILRSYDLFMSQRLAKQESDLGNLEAQQDSMRLIEGVFNEAPGLAINDLMNKFWNSWQELANNPEIIATRQTVTQSANLLIDQLHTMASELNQAKFDIGVNLDAAIDNINAIVVGISKMNVEIVGAESTGSQANDMRDRRDRLVQDLSKLLDVSFFEDGNGNYTVLLADGHALAMGDKSWEVEWSNNQLIWINQNSSGEETRRTIGSGAELGGKVGGWLKSYGELSENDPDNLSGRLNAFARSLIREMNQQHSQGAGLTMFTGTLTGAEQAKSVAKLSSTLDTTTASLSIAEGGITINEREIGAISGAAAVNGLAMAKAYNTVTAINEAETGVTAALTTLVAGAAVDASGLTAGDTVSFTLNGVSIDYTVVAGDVGSNANFAASLAAEVNSDLTTYNALAGTTNPVTIKAKAGDGTNGGAANSLVFYNQNDGDSSTITVDDLSGTFAGAATTTDIGLDALAGNTYSADSTHNTGELHLFTDSSFTLESGTNDYILSQLGLTGSAVSSFDEESGDGTLTYGPEDNDAGPLLSGYDYFSELDTSGSFEIWLYNSDGNLAIPNAVSVSLERTYSLNDVVNTINRSLEAATGSSTWLTASNSGNKLRLTADNSHKFAFANDTANFLQIAGVNTFFTGDSAASIDLNATVSDDLNKVAAAQINSQGRVFRGDNSNALSIINIQHNEYVEFTGGDINSLNGFYNSLIGKVASDSQKISRSYEAGILVNAQLQEMNESVSGVSLDEEMANLIKFQHAYTAAARLISISDEMMRDLLNSMG